MRASVFLAISALVVALSTTALPEPTVSIVTDTTDYQSGDTIAVTLELQNTGDSTTLDLCVGLLTPDGAIYTYGPAGWVLGIVPWATELRMPSPFDMTAHSYFDVPSALPGPPISQTGDYYFACLCLGPGTWNWASNLGLAPFTYGSTGPSTDITMVPIPSGSFVMGSPTSESGRDADEEPQRTVHISTFSISETEVTQKQWEDVMGWLDCDNDAGDSFPVENVSWFDCVSFCNKLSEDDGLTQCYTITDAQYVGNHITSADVQLNVQANGYRLPTEAEWEYACRAGTTTRFYTGDLESDLGLAGWFYDNSGYEKHQVGQKTPNTLGLCDAHGNVLEWCWDRYEADYYETRPNPDTDPTGPDSGTLRVVRGGSWGNSADDCRSANRYGNSPGGRYPDVGFRVARRPD